jgi:hypothetical protein
MNRIQKERGLVMAGHILHQVSYEKTEKSKMHESQLKKTMFQLLALGPIREDI